MTENLTEIFVDIFSYTFRSSIKKNQMAGLDGGGINSALMWKGFSTDSCKPLAYITHVKSQAGSRRDPAIPTWDPGWDWRDPASKGGIPPFPPGNQR